MTAERDLPQTEAGRRLLADSGPYVITGEHSLVERILAIEQEARAAEHDRLSHLAWAQPVISAEQARADLAARIEQRLLVMRATREGTTHPYDNGCVDAIDQSIAIVHEEASER